VRQLERLNSLNDKTIVGAGMSPRQKRATWFLVFGLLLVFSAAFGGSDVPPFEYVGDSPAIRWVVTFVGLAIVCETISLLWRDHRATKAARRAEKLRQAEAREATTQTPTDP
jgi:hypothetical protein